MTVWTVGYGLWPVASRANRLVEALQWGGVTRLVDTRHSPCASDIDPERPYGPRAWHLAATPDEGIVALLAEAGIAYEWAVELGNPQKRDPSQRVLRSQLADRAGGWPVHRGLERLAETIRRPGEVVALLCACAEAQKCHRTVIARAVVEAFFGGGLEIRDL